MCCTRACVCVCVTELPAGGGELSLDDLSAADAGASAVDVVDPMASLSMDEALVRLGLSPLDVTDLALLASDDFSAVDDPSWMTDNAAATGQLLRLDNGHLHHSANNAAVDSSNLYGPPC